MKSYGKAVLRDGVWLIQCEPHVAVRLKRVFGKLTRSTKGVQVLSATEENCRDLQWFVQRYPLEISDPDVLERMAGIYDRRREAVMQIVNGQSVYPDLPMALPPREYQRIAAELVRTTGGLLLADDVGIGKTVSAIATFADPALRPALVVVPTHLQRQWKAEIERFLPFAYVHIAKTMKPYDTTYRGRSPDALVINYHKLPGWAAHAAGRFSTIVFDEVQDLRRRLDGREKTQRWEAAETVSVHARVRLGLSATPIYNYGEEFWNVFEILAPGRLGTRDEFLTEWCAAGEKHPIENPRAFGTFLRDGGLMLRRTRADVGRELPALSSIVQNVESGKVEVGSETTELARLIVSQEGRGFEKMQASAQFDLRLRQATGLAKAPYVGAFVRLLLEQGPVVLFGWHRLVYETWKEQLADLQPAFYTGAETANKKAEEIARFVSGQTKLFIMSLRAGAGVDGLQKVASQVVFGELDWSPGVHVQCLDERTEILTGRGFLGPDDLVDEDQVAAFDRESGEIRWLPILSRVERELAPGEEMYSLASPTVDLRVTGAHRIIYRERIGRGKKRWSEWRETTAEQFARRTQTAEIPVAGSEKAPGVCLTDDELRFLGWFVTDGTISRSSRQVAIAQAEASPFHAAIRSCLDGAGLHYTVSRVEGHSQFERRSPLVRYAVPKYGPKGGPRNAGWAQFEPYLDKNVSPLLDDMDERQLAIFLEAVNMGDGAKQLGVPWTPLTYHIGTARLGFAERLQSLCIRRRWRANIHEGRTPAGNPHYWLHLRPRARRAIAAAGKTDRPGFQRCEAAAGERVWCVENELGTIVVRRNGKTAIIGNCTGRLHRDGQRDPVMAYYLVSDDGSDPTMVNVLDLKRQQLEGAIEPEGALSQAVTVDPHHVRRLAEAYLARKGAR